VTEYPELKELLEPMLVERNLPLPDRPPSAIDIASCKNFFPHKILTPF